MSEKSSQVQFHASSTGRLYLKEEELFKTKKFRKLINKLLDSSIYKDIKGSKHPRAATH